MLKKTFYLFCILFLSNCTVPHSAFLGPVYTGVKTGSVYQTSLSYSSSKIIRNLGSGRENKKQSSPSKVQKIAKIPKIILTYKVNPVEFSDVIEPEPLP